MLFKDSWINYALFAKGASYLVTFPILPITFSVHGVSTSQKVDCLSRCMHILHTDGAILFELVLYTWMVTLHRYAQTACAFITVEKVLFAADSAYSTAFAVKVALLFILIVKKIAN